VDFLLACGPSGVLWCSGVSHVSNHEASHLKGIGEQNLYVLSSPVFKWTTTTHRAAAPQSVGFALGKINGGALMYRANRSAVNDNQSDESKRREHQNGDGSNELHGSDQAARTLTGICSVLAGVGVDNVGARLAGLVGDLVHATARKCPYIKSSVKGSQMRRFCRRPRTTATETNQPPSVGPPTHGSVERCAVQASPSRR